MSFFHDYGPSKHDTRDRSMFAPRAPLSLALRLLGLDPRVGAPLPTKQEAQRAFRARAKLIHPDVGQGSPEQLAELIWARARLNYAVWQQESVTAAERYSRQRAAPVTPCSRCHGERRKPDGDPYPVRRRRGSLRDLRDACDACARDARLADQREKRAWRRERRVCAAPDCDATFTPKRADGRYCSAACRTRAYRERHASLPPGRSRANT